MKKLNDKEKLFLSQYYELKNDYPNIYFYIKYSCLVLFLIPIIIFIAYFLGECGYALIYTNLSIGDALGFYGSVLSFLGTISLGIVALWQNHKANQINTRLLNITEEQEIPSVDIISCNLEEFKSSKLNQIAEINVDNSYIHIDDNKNPYEDCSPFFVFKIRNVTSNNLLSISVKDINCTSIFANLNNHSKEFQSNIYHLSYDLTNVLMDKNSDCFLLISGCEYERPIDLNNTDVSAEDIYTNQGLRLSLVFEIMNSNGKIYTQKIELLIYYIPTNIITFPFVVDKNISFIKNFVHPTA